MTTLRRYQGIQDILRQLDLVQARRRLMRLATGILAVIAIAMIVMVLPELRRSGQDAMVLSVMGALVSLASVLAVSVTL